MEYSIYLNKIQVGRLFIDKERRESFSFQYEPSFLNSKDFINIDPNLTVTTKRQFPNGKLLFGFLEDMTPDRWGKALLKRKLGQGIRDSDFLLGVNDFFRMGAIRIYKEGDFLSESDGVPTIANLNKLINLSGKLTDYNADLKDLFDPGSPLGGARPKAGVLYKDKLYLAKFPKPDDDTNIEAWEQTYLELCGLLDGINTVKSHEAKKFSASQYSVLLMERFDRNGQDRVPYISAMTALNYSDGDGRGSYLDIADFITSEGNTDDTIELWRRMTFNILMNNRDDHLRNHGFLNVDGVWRLSPVFDINPVVDKNHHELSFDGNTSEPNIDVALNLADFFGLSPKDAEDWIDNSVKTIKSNIERIAMKNGISKGEFDAIYTCLLIHSDIHLLNGEPSQ